PCRRQECPGRSTQRAKRAHSCCSSSLAHRHPGRRITLYVLDRAEVFPHRELEIVTRDVILQIDPRLATPVSRRSPEWGDPRVLRHCCRRRSAIGGGTGPMRGFPSSREAFKQTVLHGKAPRCRPRTTDRSEEHTSELQSPD